MSVSASAEPRLPLWKESLGAIRANFAPGLILWAIASAVVAAYYALPSSKAAFDAVAQAKAGGGFLFSILSTGLFAGVIPFLFLWVRRRTREGLGWGAFVFMTLFWAYRGLEIDAFYRLQGMVFGNEPTVGAVAAKVACDMFLYNVIWAAHLQLLSYHWKNGGFRFAAFRNYPWKSYWTRKWPVALVSTWVVWLPVVALTYSLPANLQIPLFNLAACFWSLVVTTLTGPGASSAGA